MISNLGTNLIAFILVLGFLIFAHEAGHFGVAKLFGVRVLVFSFGFGKRLFGFRKGETDYRVSLIPLGGYVRMAGDAAEEERAGAPDEFLSKPKWQRFLILFAGPAMNILIAIVFIAFLNMSGNEVLRESGPVIGRVLPDKPAAAAGLQTGDHVVSMEGETIRNWDDLRLAIGMRPDVPMRVEFMRGGQRMTTTLKPERVVTDYGVTGVAGVTPFISTEVGRVFPETPAERAGLREGDVIRAVNGAPVTQLGEVEEALGRERKRHVALTVDRAGESVEVRLPPPESGGANYPGFIPPTRIEKLGLVPAVRESVRQNWRMVKFTFAVIGRMFKAEGSVKDFSGPLSIARISGEMLRTGWKAVVFLMGSISLQLGILNLLPIPVLDGGHIAVLGVEGISRRDLSLRVKERIQQVGFAMLAALMLVVLYNDVIQNVMMMRRG
jgi:regulator of sigma E protease